MDGPKLCLRNIGRIVRADHLEREIGPGICLISYKGSRIDDPEDFFQAFRATKLWPCKAFGGKETRGDATSDYHVLVALDRVTTLGHIFRELWMRYNFDFQDEVDTYKIEVRVKRDEQYNYSFMKDAQDYMLHAIDPGTRFGDQDLSPFPGGAETSVGSEMGVDSGLFEIGGHAPAISTPIYPGTKSIAAFLGLKNCPPRRTSPCEVSKGYSGTKIRSVASTLDLVHEDEGNKNGCLENDEPDDSYE